MKFYYFHAIILCLSLLTFSPLKAQVTIGFESAPGKAALLQIKDQEADLKNVTCTKGGLILPRVELVNLTTLEPFMHPDTTPDYDIQKVLHVGLLVYNIASTSTLNPGLYFWTGDNWDIIKSSSKPKDSGDNSDISPNDGEAINLEDDIPTSYMDENATKLSNTYIVTPGTTVDIPIIKAYAVWKQLLNLDLNMNSDISAELLWQDEKNLIKSISLADGNKKEASEIRVTTNKEVEGNAVIAIKVGDNIRWSWHLWITRYDPNTNTSQKPFNERIFMDRNLGALSTTPGNITSLGTLYQWGRKDPLPGSAKITGNTDKELYSINNEIIDIFKKMPVQDSDNLANTIINPATLYTAQNDWYSNNKYSNNLWNSSTGTKTIYDPCPKGWRVPPAIDANKSVWDGLKPEDAMINPFENGKGYEWTTAGYYPAAGYRKADGTLEAVGSSGRYWSAEAASWGSAAFELLFYNFIHVRSNQAKVEANSVRCIKE